MIRETSREAYKNIKPKINKLQREVFDALQMKAQATNAELAEHLGWSINRITPRIFELRTLGLVVPVIKRRCFATGNNAYVWRPAGG